MNEIRWLGLGFVSSPNRLSLPRLKRLKIFSPRMKHSSFFNPPNLVNWQFIGSAAVFRKNGK